MRDLIDVKGFAELEPLICTMEEMTIRDFNELTEMLNEVNGIIPLDNYDDDYGELFSQEDIEDINNDIFLISVELNSEVTVESDNAIYEYSQSLLKNVYKTYLTLVMNEKEITNMRGVNFNG